MAIAVAMSNDVEGKDVDGHEHDLVMPGFRFHPTEEELIDFYLRRKVEGKQFNVELITFLDLYRYDPWELPALAAIGEKEWFFYVPRDRKYRNGDRPNRVTTSGYWKATGADRMIRNESLRSIGLKKTLVFYSGKAPKGIRTSWIMNEYRLPQSETDRYHKAEISLCRVYKRAGVDDHRRLSHSGRTSSFPNSTKHSTHQPSSSEGGQSMICNAMKLNPHDLYPNTNSALLEQHANKADNSPLSSTSILPSPPLAMAPSSADDLHRLVGYSSHSYMQQLHPCLKTVPVSLSTISEKLLEWNSLPYAARDQDNSFN